MLGEEHPDMQRNMNNLAITLWQMDEHFPALQLMQTAAEGWVRVLGPDHPYALRFRQKVEWMRAELGQ